ncbi:MAG: Ribonuclease HI [Microgenomates group bacterium GW2011_GWC1_43_13]|uniref:Ribonuclease HI n=3 Tax=Candidatus Woeseibacteriota TaxID=1752722 RepID=A0A837IDQ7_9BACT|nr:MAG: Ribonuclease HI [Microgenomates group bacterium GW2011_GWC1_43_13]KKT54625.1 MAG: Ribonuclease HI [Candidatus Woesebacteria bacterium GW2011_GWA1_44_23]
MCYTVCMNEETVIIHTDGGARGNPGPAACAFIAEVGGKIIKQDSSFLGNSTNNNAEYQGVILALKWLVDSYKALSLSNAIFYLDSELVVRQLNGVYKLKNKKLIELFFQIATLSRKINLKINYRSIPRTDNIMADFLVNKELDKQSLAK